MKDVHKFEEFKNIIEKKSIRVEIPRLKIEEEYRYDENYKLNKFIGKYLSFGEIVQIIPIDNDLQIVIKKFFGDNIYLSYSSKSDKFIMGQLKLTDKDNNLLNDIVSEFKNETVKEGVAYPTTKPTVAPGIKQAPGKASPLRRDKPSVVPGPKAITELDLANKFLNLTKNNNGIITLLKRKYNK